MKKQIQQFFFVYFNLLIQIYYSPAIESAAFSFVLFARCWAHVLNIGMTSVLKKVNVNVIARSQANQFEKYWINSKRTNVQYLFVN